MTDRDDARSLPPDEAPRRVQRPAAPSAPGWPPPPAVPPERYAAPRPGGGAPGPPPRSRPGPAARRPTGPPPGEGYAPPAWNPPAPPGPGFSWGGGQAPPGYGQAPPGPGSPPGYGQAPPGPGYGQAPPGFGRPAYIPPGPAQLRHRPGAGLIVGLVGLALLVASLAGLPWISVGGEDATLRDIGDAYSALDGLDVGDGGIFAPPDVTAPDASVPDITLPDGSSPDDGLGPVVTPPGTVDDTYTPPSSGDLEPFHELYAKGLCWAVAVWAALALVVAALWVPRGKGGRMGLGFVVGGLVGLVANALDERGRVGPRVTGAFVAVVCLAAHTVAAMEMFGEDGAPDPAIGVWAGVVGLLLVVVGCAVGTRTDEAPARW
jgi:hypothetical protein